MTATAESTSPESVPLVEGRGLSKRYGPVHAVDDVSLSIGRGEVVAIVGDNGAGKSTLVKMLSGALHPDAGELWVEGRRVHFRGPGDSRAEGIETIYQDLALLPNLDVVTNLYLGRERPRSGVLGSLGFVDRRAMRAEATERLGELRINIPKISGTPVESLSGGQRQSVAVARAVFWASKLLIMDEPTAALGVAQSAAVLDLVRRVRESGTSVIIVSHILPHILELADRIVVFRHGRKVGDVPAGGITQSQLVELIVGITAAA
jgi:ABC-type sugar transport system ATPase subunit